MAGLKFLHKKDDPKIAEVKRLVFQKDDSKPDKQIVLGVVYAPGIPDSHNDFMAVDEIEKMAYRFAKEGDFTAIDVHHDNKTYGCYVVESFIVRKGDPDFPIEGSWVVGVYIPDETLWNLVKTGELNGFSMEVLAHRNEGELEIEAPGYAWGRTDKTEDHEHDFEVYYNDEGQLVAGRTDEYRAEDGTTHFHIIQRGTATDKSAGHSHRFAFIDKIVGVKHG